MIKLKKPLIG